MVEYKPKQKASSTAKSTAWQRVEAARNPQRPTARYFISELLPDFIELHGDRRFSDDHAIIGGIGTFNKMPITMIGQEKGVSISEKIKCNFGSPHPEGYRKALRLFKQAEKFGRPIITIVDTQGAYCGIGAEERGQGQAIAENLMTLMTLKVPVIAILIGEGGSGGALALAVADRVVMLENAVYSILSPEGFASILWKDATRSKEAAELMKITAEDVKKLGVIEEVLSEPHHGAHQDPAAAVDAVRKYIAKELKVLTKLPVDQLLQERYARYRNMGTCEPTANGQGE